MKNMRQKGAIELLLLAIVVIIVLAAGTWYLIQSPSRFIPQSATQPTHELSTSQQYIIQELGGPQAFHVIFADQDRIETWFYYDQYATFTFTNGNFVQEHLEVEPLDTSAGKRTSSAMEPNQVTQTLSPEALGSLMGTDPIEVLEEEIEGEKINVYVYPKGVSASFDDTNQLLTFYAYPYYAEN